MIACENIGRFHGNDQKTGLLKKKTVFPEGDRFFYVEQSGTAADKNDRDHHRIEASNALAVKRFFRP
jgi:hypothetical protein